MNDKVRSSVDEYLARVDRQKARIAGLIEQADKTLKWLDESPTAEVTREQRALIRRVIGKLRVNLQMEQAVADIGRPDSDSLAQCLYTYKNVQLRAGERRAALRGIIQAGVFAWGAVADDGDTLLHSACCGGAQSEELALLLANGCDPDQVNSVGLLPLVGYVSREQGMPYEKGTRLLAEKMAPETLNEVLSDAIHTLLEERERGQALKEREKCVRALIETEGVDVNRADGAGRTGLHHAIRAGSADSVNAMLEAGAEVASEGGQARGYMRLAAGEGKPEIIRALVEKGAAVNGAGSDGNTPLHAAGARWRLEAAEYLVEAGADVNAVNGDGVSVFSMLLNAHPPLQEDARRRVLMKLLKAGANPVTGMAPLGEYRHSGAGVLQRGVAVDDDPDLLAAIMKWNPDINDRDEDGNTALHVAARRGHSGSIRRLLALGAAAGVQNDKGETPLMLAATAADCEDSTKALLGAKDNNINAKRMDGDTVLIALAKTGNVEMTALILAAGPDPDMADRDGRTPMDHLCQWGNAEGVRRLIAMGASTDCRDKSGNTPLAAACLNGRLGLKGIPPGSMEGRKALLDILIGNGVDINGRDGAGESVLAKAVYCSNPVLAKELVDRGADAGLTNSEGLAPLHIAIDERARKGRYTVRAPNTGEELIEVLVAGGAEPDQPMPDGEAPVSWALRHGEMGTVDALITAGADITKLDHQTQRWIFHEMIEHVGYYQDSLGRLVKAGVALEDVHAGTNILASDKYMSWQTEKLKEGPHSVSSELTALQRACSRGAISMVRQLIAAGADPNNRGASGRTPLWYLMDGMAGAGAVLEAASVLLSAGAQVDEGAWGNLLERRYWDSNPATSPKRRQLLLLLLDHADIKDTLAMDKITLLKQVPLLHRLVGMGAPKEDISLVLAIDQSAVIEPRADNGDTPLHVASAGSVDAGVVALLLEKGADPNSANHDGDTPLHIALSRWDGYRDSQALRLRGITSLLEYGADLGIQDKEGRPLGEMLKGFLDKYGKDMPRGMRAGLLHEYRMWAGEAPRAQLRAAG